MSLITIDSETEKYPASGKPETGFGGAVAPVCAERFRFFKTNGCEAEKIRIADDCHTDSVAPSRLSVPNALDFLKLTAARQKNTAEQ